MKELLGQRAEWRKSHHVSLNRDLILQSPQSEWNKEVRLLFLEKENRACKQKTAAASPEMPASIRNRGKVAFCQSWSHSFSHLTLTPSKNSVPSHQILSHEIHNLLSPKSKQENILSSRGRRRMGGKEV